MGIEFGTAAAAGRGDAASRHLLVDLAHRVTLDHGAPIVVRSAPCTDCGRAHGAPLVTGASRPLWASLTHAAGLAIAVVSDERPVGIDAEPRSQPATRTRDIARLLGTGQDVAIERWTQIEAVLKADGRGLRVDPGRVRVEGTAAELEGVDYALTSPCIAGVPDDVIVTCAEGGAAAAASAP
ncbi:hypothetical protein GCM10009808_23750 [Microbacterium sediminicola]|uniref:4'-phosphopantetheinyl transferase n=1 Tax=Microbacterium sediminicola TaxID=415210 RepID=A0ABP4UG58_9MICO